jgi:nucleoside diphosphate kinase
MERTFAIIKPDAVSKGLIGTILSRIESEGFTVRAMRLVHLTQAEAEGFYAVHRERPFFGSLSRFMSSGPCVVLALEAPDAIRRWRDRAQCHARIRRSRDCGLRARIFLPGSRVRAVIHGRKNRLLALGL